MGDTDRLSVQPLQGDAGDVRLLITARTARKLQDAESKQHRRGLESREVLGPGGDPLEYSVRRHTPQRRRVPLHARAHLGRGAEKQLIAMGRKPYIIPLGGSNVVGATGYVLAMKELMEQLAKEQLNIDFIVFASSSGGTQAGIVLGAQVYGYKGNVLGISVDHPADTLQTQVGALATATATHLGLEQLPMLDHVVVNDDYLGEGYAVVSDLEKEAIRLVAQKEGILLDPVYTGRAMGGLIDLIRWGAFTRGQKVLFWHTGGTAALPAFANSLL